MEIQDLDIVIVSKQESPRKSEHYDCDAELARKYIDPITMSKIWIWQESMCRIGTRNWCFSRSNQHSMVAVIDWRKSQSIRKENKWICWFRNSKSWDMEVKHSWLFWVMPQIKRQGAIRYRFKRIKECWTRSVSWAIDKAWIKFQRKGVLRCFTMKPRPQKMLIEMSPSFMGKAMRNECLCHVYG